MPRHDNYPDDIRQYDHDPRSPFYKPQSVECKACGKHVMEDEVIEDPHGADGFFCDEDCYKDYYANDCCGEVECVCE